MNMQMYFHSCIWLEAAVTLFTLKEVLVLKQLSRIGALFVLGKNVSFTRNLLRKYCCSLGVKPQELCGIQSDFWFILIEAKQKGSTSSTNAILLLTPFHQPWPRSWSKRKRSNALAQAAQETGGVIFSKGVPEPWGRGTKWHGQWAWLGWGLTLEVFSILNSTLQHTSENHYSNRF